MEIKSLMRIVDDKAENLEFKQLEGVVKYMPKNEDLVDLYNKVTP